MTPAHKSRRSIAVTETGKRKLREAQKRKGGKRITYEDIEEKLEFQVSRSTIERFFRGKAVELENAMSIVEVLGLDLQEVVDVAQYQNLILG